MILIAAISDNYVIGKDNKLLWNQSNDLKRFKELTTNKTVVMGRKTFDSLPFKNGFPNRTNIILTRKKSENFNSCYFTDNLELIPEDSIIIGGDSIYHQTFSKIDTMYITWIHHNFDGDSFFPTINENEWEIISCESFKSDDKNQYDYTFIEYKRI